MRSLRKLVAVHVLLVVVMCACSGDKKPAQNLYSGFPGIEQGSGDVVLQCRAQLLSKAETTSAYRSTYFSLGADGTEKIQSIVEGPRPCP